MNIKNIISMTSLIMVTGCQAISTVYPPEHKVLVVGDTLIYDGMITGEATLEAIRIIRDGNKPIKKLKITSSGGDMAVGIEFGYFIKEHKLDVEVNHLCFSACANYVLPAANSIVIDSSSLIGWHGGAKQSDELWKLSVPSKDRPAFMVYLNRLRQKETDFFNYVGVDQKITTYGQIIKNSCQMKEKTDGWYYSIDDIKKMGIKNIKINDSKLLEKLEYNNKTLTSCLLDIGK
ncbi:S49 family peptidase domain-containing protein [Vibrio owensii]|uniref:hypothetical protein n=1 Tax=Vibrio owensii TaxID=696485 RepID=UPI0005ED9B4A|nr:hypothetical protein [Vibrio owensii]